MAHAARLAGGPATRQGLRALRLVAAGLLLVAVAVAVAVLDGPWFFGPVGFVGLLVIVAGGVLAVVAVFGQGERSLLVLATIPLWLVVLFLVVGELALPH